MHPISTTYPDYLLDLRAGNETYSQYLSQYYQKPEVTNGFTASVAFIHKEIERFIDSITTKPLLEIKAQNHDGRMVQIFDYSPYAIEAYNAMLAENNLPVGEIIFKARKAAIAYNKAARDKYGPRCPQATVEDSFTTIMVNSLKQGVGFAMYIEFLNDKAKGRKSSITIYNINTMKGDTIIQNGHGNTANTGDHVNIHAANSIKGSWEAIYDYLQQHEVEQSDIDEIQQILNEEQPSETDQNIGPKAISWITKIVGKALSGSGKLLTGISSNVLGALIRNYYNLP